ncbi:LysM domain-containing protein [Pyxidicoccus fallax]|uniref:LysM domain-containing protein n=1 Tax=Pyxidicoccus fallax TaxID=394095 RepID=A0A848L8U5_9BACT|nr:LysM domain-containing protein [Pyxidicoccus fallax]NMO15410.1 LysM domain-containing protein [Pyxidicoccus fallax]NPC79105.1 LysM domain-containing protein [Pyxidicoccus fallax]
MIDKKSRYAKVPVFELEGPDGQERHLLELRETPSPGGFFYATPVEGERLDHLAHRYYRDPLKFWRICDASEHLDPFDVVVPGVPVLIPPND